jgi:hypothetical protein
MLKISPTVQINNEISCLVSIALATKTDHFKAAMKDGGIPEECVSEILLSVAATDDLVSNVFDKFKSVKTMEKYLTNNESYVAPVTYPLGKGKFQYIPVTRTLQKICSDPAFEKLRSKGKNRSEEEDDSLEFCLSDIHDGRRIRNMDFFKRNPDALRQVEC